jgi:hypothetical protein
MAIVLKNKLLEVNFNRNLHFMWFEPAKDDGEFNLRQTIEEELQEVANKIMDDAEALMNAEFNKYEDGNL